MYNFTLVRESPNFPSEARNVREAFGTLDSSESGETGVETGVGKVSERSSEGKESRGAGDTRPAGRGSDDAVHIRQQLLASKPPKTVMLLEIKRHFRKETHVLHKDLRKYERQGDWHRYNGVVARLRQIREIFEQLVHATYDAIKNVWLKVVHGIV